MPEDRIRPAVAFGTAITAATLATSSTTPNPPLYSIDSTFQQGAKSVTTVTEPMLAARIEAVEARLETKAVDRFSALADQIRDLSISLSGIKSDIDIKIAALGATISDVDTKVSSVPGRATIWGAAAATIGAGVAILVLSAGQFGSGFQSASNYTKELNEASQRIQLNTAQLESLQKKAIADANVGESPPKQRP